VNNGDNEQWRIGADIGGTFTDVVLERANQNVLERANQNGLERADALFSAKVLTNNEHPEISVLDGVKQVLAEADVRPQEIAQVIHGTTLATNALIERKGARTAMITTEGFRDVLEMGSESRFDQYDLNLQKPTPLIPRHLRIVVPERMSATGDILLDLDEAALRDSLSILKEHDIESVAIALLHSYVNPAHEQRVRDIIQTAWPDIELSLSSEVSPEIREFDRFTTTAANAYIQPFVAPYLRNLERLLNELGVPGALYLMLSNGGISDLETACRFPVRLIESGPAGGAILAGHIADQCGLDQVVSYDMGGTTAKVCLIDQAVPSTARELEVAREFRFKRGSGMPLRIPVIELVEIGAGGGSISGVNGLGLISVGPESAGSTPGPACYDLGGDQPTVTDSNLILGRISPDLFAGGRMTLNTQAATTALQTTIADPLSMSLDMASVGVVEMVDENMANATREHAIERGKSIENRTMIAFGGSAPLHAARLAQKLGIRQIVVPTGAGVGSAIGFLRAPIAFEVVRSLYQRLGSMDVPRINTMLQEMAAEASAFVRRAAGDVAMDEERYAFMRFVGQNHEISVRLPNGELASDIGKSLRETFNDTYRSQFGRALPRVEIEVTSWSVVIRTPRAPGQALAEVSPQSHTAPCDTRSLWDPAVGERLDAEIVHRDALAVGDQVTGPAVIVEDETSTVIPARFRAHINQIGYIVIDAMTGDV